MTQQAQDPNQQGSNEQTGQAPPTPYPPTPTAQPTPVVVDVGPDQGAPEDAPEETPRFADVWTAAVNLFAAARDAEAEAASTLDTLETEKSDMEALLQDVTRKVGQARQAYGDAKNDSVVAAKSARDALDQFVTSRSG